MKGQAFAVFSGLIAASASLCGKFIMSSDETLDLCMAMLSANDETKNFVFAKAICEKYLAPLRAFFFVLMFILNCIMWTTFTKALRFTSTSLEATIINTASNFFFTAIIGQVLLEEVVTSLWWMGTVLILCGLLIMHHSRNAIHRKPGTRLKSHNS